MAWYGRNATVQYSAVAFYWRLEPLHCPSQLSCTALHCTVYCAVVQLCHPAVQPPAADQLVLYTAHI